MVSEKKVGSGKSGCSSWVGMEKIVVQKNGALLNHGMLDGLTGVGSVIYAMGKWDGELGGVIENPDEEDLIHSGASLLDSSSSSSSSKNKWKPFVFVSLGDKIFVFGGTGKGAPAAFGEFRETATKKWHMIHPPPINSDPVNPWVFLDSHNDGLSWCRILLPGLPFPKNFLPL